MITQHKMPYKGELHNLYAYFGMSQVPPRGIMRIIVNNDSIGVLSMNAYTNIYETQMDYFKSLVVQPDSTINHSRYH